MVIVQAKVIDATHLELSEPIAGLLGREVLVSVAESNGADPDRDQWRSLSADGLRSAYGDSEPEYQRAMVREQNPEYDA